MFESPFETQTHLPNTVEKACLIATCDLVHKYKKYIPEAAEQSSRAIKGMKCFLPLKYLDRWFESHSRQRGHF
jgi:hypothetical protein